MPKATVDVDLVLDGDKLTVTLKPSLQAIKNLSRHGGLVNVAQQCAAADFEAILRVVQEGAQYTQSGMKSNQIEDRIFETGVMEVGVKATEYVMVLMNGGKPIEGEGEVENPK